jgi:uncharacterized glyoxalase superfamily protein PhnB
MPAGQRELPCAGDHPRRGTVDELDPGQVEDQALRSCRRGVSFHYTTDSAGTVDEVIAKAAAAGGAIVKEAASSPWGGYFGYFSDPDGYLWKAATSA